jgi:hypothetical protein
MRRDPWEDAAALVFTVLAIALICVTFIQVAM